jgi:hypothetical protein
MEAGPKTPGIFALDAQGLARDFTKVIYKEQRPREGTGTVSADHFGSRRRRGPLRSFVAIAVGSRSTSPSGVTESLNS